MKFFRSFYSQLSNASKNTISATSNVVCTHNALVTTVTFPQSFHGIVYARGYSQDCAVSGNGTKTIKFKSDVHKCGIKVLDVNGFKEFELYLYVQHDPSIQQSNDERILVRCAPQEIHVSGAFGRRNDNGENKPNVKNVNGDNRILVKTMSNHQLAESTVDSIECWMDIMKGRLPFLKAINGFVDIGEDVTVLIKIKNICKITDLKRLS
ncbi:uncharacterized protein B4U79_00051 [Dinothrombium tinctorium]|uniref:ZP domain-containing protein n=1 Tax=Dinothrombium tinctorium TaxID=1965070 RepID=A0A3S3PA56_9ACAR|nr:uncharacterized protein B4U79_00051 [Dinothrombium tinctorium]